VLSHLLTHLAGVIGLTLNTAGAIGLLKFPTPEPDAGGVFPHETMESLRSGMAINGMPGPRRAYAAKVFAYCASIWALVLGFFLQLIDLLVA
jgi:hypothetical protein